MEIIKISKDRMNTILTPSIKKTDVISENAKKVLATIMNYHYVLDVCKQSRYLIISTDTLRQSVGIKKESLLTALQELIEYDLIERIVGKKWKKGERPTASKYIVRWENLKKELKKKNSDDLISSFLNPSENSMGTIVSVSDIVSVNVNDSVSVNDNVIDNDSDIEKENNIKEKKDSIMEKDEDIKKPTNLKELQDFFRFKIIKKTKDCVTVEDLLKLKGDMEEELEKYEFIPSYSNCLFSIKNYFNRKVEEFQFNQLSS